MRATIVNYRYTWRKDWISPYESLWSIFEKFKYANCATVRNIYDLLGTDYVRNLKSDTIGRPHRDCIHPTGLDDDLVESAFMEPILKINSQNIDRLVGTLSNHSFNPRFSYLRDELFFCSECIKIGLHSLFHQFKSLNECPYHQIRLHKGCLNCNQQIPFELTDQYTKEPFRCKCSYSFLEHNTKKNDFLNWKSSSPSAIQLKKVVTWLQP
jgi:hypothetical protein